MKKLHSTHKPLEIILLIIIVLLVGSISGYAYWTNKQIDKLTVVSETPTVAKSVYKPTGQAKAGKLTIKEWNVALSVSGVASDADYWLAKNSDMAYLSTATIDRLPACVAARKAYPSSPSHQSIIRHMPTDKVEQAPGYMSGTVTAAFALSKFPDSFKQIDGYIYEYTVGNGVECSRDQAVRRALGQLLPTLTSVK
ncbi:hypothetical protein H7Y63_01635 [Polaromonas sp.]|nr:hypothetical protein [Candidatus Saccharibacteria bacterium]